MMQHSHDGSLVTSIFFLHSADARIHVLVFKKLLIRKIYNIETTAKK